MEKTGGCVTSAARPIAANLNASRRTPCSRLARRSGERRAAERRTANRASHPPGVSGVPHFFIRSFLIKNPASVSLNSEGFSIIKKCPTPSIAR